MLIFSVKLKFLFKRIFGFLLYFKVNKNIVFKCNSATAAVAFLKYGAKLKSFRILSCESEVADRLQKIPLIGVSVFLKPYQNLFEELDMKIAVRLTFLGSDRGFRDMEDVSWEPDSDF